MPDKVYDESGKLIYLRRPTCQLELETPGPCEGHHHAKRPGQVPPCSTGWPESQLQVSK